MIFLLRTRRKCRPARQRNCHAGTLSCYLQSFRDFQRICVWNKGNGYFRTFIRFDVKTWNSLFSCTFLKSFLVIGSFLTRFKHPEALMPRLTKRNTGFDVSWTSSTSVITIDKIDIANMNRKKIVFSIARDTQQTTPIISYFSNYSQSSLPWGGHGFWIELLPPGHSNLLSTVKPYKSIWIFRKTTSIRQRTTPWTI